jgi:hypothetical protein
MPALTVAVSVVAVLVVAIPAVSCCVPFVRVLILQGGGTRNAALCFACESRRDKKNARDNMGMLDQHKTGATH